MSVEELKLRGNEAFRRGDFDAAIASFSEGLALDPDNHLLLSNRCMAFCRKRMLEDALADAEKCMAVRPDFHKGYLRLGHTLEHLGYRDEALECYKEGLELFADETSFKEATESLLKKKTDPRNKGNPFNDHDVMDRLLVHPDLLEFMYEDDVPPMVVEIRKFPQLFEKIKSDRRFKKMAEIMADIDDIEELMVDGVCVPSIRFIKRPRTKEQWTKYPLFEIEVREPEPTIEEILAPITDPVECNKIGNQRRNLSFRDALACYRRALEFTPNVFLYAYNAACTLHSSGRQQESLPDIFKALDIHEQFGGATDKQLANLYANIGETYLRADRLEESVEFFEKSVALFDTVPNIVLFHQNIAVKELRQKREDEHNDPVISYNERELGKRFFNATRFQKAIDHFTIAIDREESEKVRARHFRKRGLCSLKLKRFADAVSDANSSIKLDKKFNKAYLLKGDAYVAHGHHEKEAGNVETANGMYRRACRAFRVGADSNLDNPSVRALNSVRDALDFIDKDSKVQDTILTSLCEDDD